MLSLEVIGLSLAHQSRAKCWRRGLLTDAYAADDTVR